MRCPWNATVSSKAPATTVELRCSLTRAIGSGSPAPGPAQATAEPTARKLAVSSWRFGARIASAVDILFLDAQALRARNRPGDCRHEN